MKHIKKNFKWLAIVAGIALFIGILILAAGLWLVNPPLNRFAGTSSSRAIVGLVGVGILIVGFLISLYGGLILLLSYLAKKKYARTEKQIRTYRILTAAACIIAVVPTLFNSFYWQLMMDYFFAPFFLYLVLIVVAVIINCINTFTNRIWDEQPTTEFVEKQQ